MFLRYLKVLNLSYLKKIKISFPTVLGNFSLESNPPPKKILLYKDKDISKDFLEQKHVLFFYSKHKQHKNASTIRSENLHVSAILSLC